MTMTIGGQAPTEQQRQTVREALGLVGRAEMATYLGQVSGKRPLFATPTGFVDHLGTPVVLGNLQASVVGDLAVVTVAGQQFAMLPYTAGAVTANVVMRTGTYAALIGLDGTDGEIAVPSDVPALIRYTGVAGKAQVFKAYGHIVREDLTDYANLTKTLTVLNFSTYVATGSLAAGAATLSLPAGYERLQALRIVNDTDRPMFIGWSGAPTAISLNQGQYVDLLYNINGEWVRAGSGANADYVGAGSVAYGLNSTAVGTNSMVLGDGASCDSDYSTVLGANGFADFDNSLVQGRGRMGRMSQRQTFCIGNRTTGTANAQATLGFDGIGGSNISNFPVFSAGIARCKMTLIGRKGTTTVDFARFVREFDLTCTTAGVHAILNTITPVTDHLTAAMAGCAVTVSVGTGDRLLVTVTGPTTVATVNWVAWIEVTSVAG